MTIQLMTLMAKLGLDAREFEQGLSNAEKTAASGSRGITGALSGVAKGATVAAAAITAVAAASAGMAIKLAADAAPLEGIERAYRGITGGGEDMLQMMRKQSYGMITDRQLMTSYNQAAQLVSKSFADQLPDAMRYLSKVSAATGQDMGFMMDSLVRGVGRLSPMILDNLGIQVDLASANEAYANKIGKTVEELTKEEQQIALTNQVMEKLAQNTANMPEVAGTASQALGSMSTWFKNLKDDVGMAFLPALKELLSFLNMLAPVISDIVVPALQSLGGWVADVTREWTQGFASLIARAATWGANIVESLASGITGSNAISRALRSVANTITAWLEPGSPPKLLPNLTKWGAGSIQAWLDGWSLTTLAESKFARDLRTSLRPLLEEIDLGKDIDPSRLDKLFGAGAVDVAPYLTAYHKMGTATKAVADAREALAKAEEEGDEEAIKAAKEKLSLAENDEVQARRSFYDAEYQMARRIAAEEQLAKAVETTSQATQKAADTSARIADDAAKRAAEAEQKAIEQAFLQYRLAVAGTAAAQIPIWQEELAKVAEGSAEYWNIMTRIVELQRAAAKDTGKKVGSALGEGVDDSLSGGIVKSIENSADAVGETTEKIDWRGLGGAMASALWEGFKEVLASIPAQLLGWSESFLEWTKSSAVITNVNAIGFDIGLAIGEGISLFLGLDKTAEDIGDNIFAMLLRACENIGGGVIELGKALGRGLYEGIFQGATGKTTGQSLNDLINEHNKAIKESEPSWWEKLMENYGKWYAQLPPWLSGLPETSVQATPTPQSFELPSNIGNTNTGMIIETGGIVVNLNNVSGSEREEARIGVLEALRSVGVP